MKSGDIHILEEGANLPALTSVGGYLYISPGITFDYSTIEFGPGLVLAVWEYALHVKDGKYCAGCRGPWTAEQAMRHWDTDHHKPRRAELFREAIKAREAVCQ